MSSEIRAGRKVAVHCHAGLGRTGLAIACYLVYDCNMTAEEAIMLVRAKRPGSVQTPKQAGFVASFSDFLSSLREKVVLPPSVHGKYALCQVMDAHRSLMHGVEARLVVHKVCFAIPVSPFRFH